MSTLKATRSAQYPVTATFAWNYADTMVNTVGNSVDFGAANLGGAAGKFDIINLPKGAVVVSGYIVTKTTFDTAGYDITVGDSTTENRYLASTDLKTAGAVVPLVPTGYISTGQNLRITMSSDDVCTAGDMYIVVTYIIDGKANEAVTN